MTDRYNALIVVLENDIRDDDAESVIAAIAQLRGVLSVQGHVVDGIDQLVAEQRVRLELQQKLREALKP
jgi:uncharacterized coiled-coil protein SlyX